MDAYSKEFRRDVLAAWDASGGKTKAVACQFGVSESWVRRIQQDRREKGKLAPATTRNRVPQWAKEADQIKAAIERQPDLTLDELKVELGTKLSRSTLGRALQALRLSLKKSPESRRAAATGRGVAASRLASQASGARPSAIGLPR